MRDFAHRLIVYEAKRQRKPVGTGVAQTFAACEKVRPHLAAFMGNAGVHALVSRALALAGEDVQWLREIRVNGDGSLQVPAQVPAQLDPEEMTEGRVVLLAQELGLLVAFIGGILTVRLVRDVWPGVPLNDLNLSEGVKSEKNKQHT
jgi:hypothetical protein